MKKVCILIVGLVLSATASAQQSDRAGNWEFGLLVNNLSSESLSGENGSSIDTKSSTGFGFSLGYNFTERLALGGEFSWNSPTYNATLITDDIGNTPVEIKHELDFYSLIFKGTFNLLEGPFTPYVEASYGWTELDSNIADSPPVTGCWWDPWWGYMCAPFYSTYSESLTSWSAGVGIRWDVNRMWGIKASYGITELDTSSNTEDAQLDMVSIEAIFRY